MVLIELPPPWWSLVHADEGTTAPETLWEVLREHRNTLAERAELVCREFAIEARTVVHHGVRLERDIARWRRSGAMVVDVRARPVKSVLRRLVYTLRGGAG